MSEVATWPFERRLEETLRRALPKLGPEARQQIEAILTPQALAIVAAVLVAWVASHAFGVGEIVDIIILAVGVVSIGLAIFSGLDHLYEFAAGAYSARSEAGLEAAADRFAQAVGILGITAVLAVLFRGRPQTASRSRVNVGSPPPRTPGASYRPTIRSDPRLAAGEGSTSAWGDIVVSSRGSATDRALVLMHERVHQFLTPKLYALRQFRVESHMGSYMRSSFRRYLEEALAETVAQIGVVGMSRFFTGIRFPVQNGYVYLMRAGGYSSAMGGRGVVPEGAGLIATGLLASGLSFDVWFSTQAPREPAR